MTRVEAIDKIRATVALIVARKLTGKHIIVIDANQGGIGSVRIYGASKDSEGCFFIGPKGLDRLIEWIK